MKSRVPGQAGRQTVRASPSVGRGINEVPVGGRTPLLGPHVRDGLEHVSNDCRLPVSLEVEDPL